MGFLADAFREQTGKMKDYAMSLEHEFDIAYPTKFLTFDFLNGNIVDVRHADGSTSQYYSIGLVDGSINTFIGRSGCGKTTFAIQAAYNIISDFKDATMYIDSVEGGVTVSRLSTLTGLQGAELRQRIIDRNTGVTAENFYQRIKLIYDIKVQNRDRMMYDTGKTDDLGNPIQKMIPTPYILDSLAMLMPETYLDEQELAGQMAATAAAKTNTRILKMIVPKLKTANIILILINHINQKVEINQFSKTPNQLSYLDPGETMPGGNAAIYLANNIIKFYDKKLDPTKGLGIEGYEIRLKLMKSRTNRSGRECYVVFDQANGFDPDLSLFITLKEAGLIVGAGAFFHLVNHDTKFTQKGFKEKLKSDPELKRVFVQTALEYLKSTIDSGNPEISARSYDTVDSIIAEMNNPTQASTLPS